MFIVYIHENSARNAKYTELIRYTTFIHENLARKATRSETNTRNITTPTPDNTWTASGGLWT